MRVPWPGAGRALIAALLAAALPPAASAVSSIALDLTPVTAIGERVDLARAINQALANNRSLALTGRGIRGGELGITGAEAEFRVSARPVAAFSLNDGDDASTYGLELSRRLVTGTELRSRLVSEDTLDAAGRERLTLALEQPLFRNAGRLINREPVVVANAALDRAWRRYEQQKIDLVVDVVRAYQAILELERTIASDHRAVARTRQLLRLTRAKQALGRTTQIDTLRVEVQLSETLSRLNANRERLDAQRRDFAELLGVPPQTVYLLDEAAVERLELPPVPEAVEVALANRLELAQAMQDHRDSLRGIAIANRGLLPDLRLVARYEYREEGGPAVDDGGGRWFLGFRTDTDLNRVREQVNVGQSRNDAAAAAERIELTRLTIAREVQQAIGTYRRAYSELGIARRLLDHAEARLRLARRLFEIGRETNFTVTDAEEAHARAQSQLAAARSQAAVSGYALRRAMGTLTEVPSSLRPGNRGGFE